jgi:hypothetical protein
MGLDWDELPEELRNSLQESYKKYQDDPVFKKHEKHELENGDESGRTSRNNEDDKANRLN